MPNGRREQHATARGLSLGLALFLAVAFPGERAIAADPAGPPPAAAAPPQTLSSDDLNSLLATLQNDAERAKFVAQLKALIAARAALAKPPAPAAPAGDLLSRLSDAVGQSSEALVAASAVLFDVHGLVSWVERQASNPEARQDWLETLGKLAVTLALAALGGALSALALRRSRAALAARPAASLALAAALGLARLVVELTPLAVFAGLAYGVLSLSNPSLHARRLTLVIVNASVSLRALMILARVLLLPVAAGPRLLALSEETASYCLVWLRRLASLAIYGYFATEAALLLDLPSALQGAIVRAVGLALAVLVILLVLQNRGALARRIRGKPAEAGEGTALQLLRARFSEIWHVLAILYIAAVYVVWAARSPGGADFLLRATLFSLAVLLLARLLGAGGERLLRRFFAIGPELKGRLPSLEARANRYLPILTKLLHAAVWLAAILALLEAWGLDSYDMLFSGFGLRLVSSLAGVAATLVVALAAWEALSIMIELYLARRAEEGSEAYKRARAHTVLPLLRTTLSIAIAIIAALTALAALGVNIGPLLAGVGVAGVAVGFGAQTLVKDLITGVFIVIEDTIAVGDVVTVADKTGTVEAISIRSLRLRDGAGGLHTIPFSDVGKILNLTKDYAYAVFEIGVGYREDIDRVMESVKALGAELANEERWKGALLAPLEMQGVERFGESAVIISARIETRPGRQWDVTREFNRRLKRRFDELGIEMPFPTRTLHLEADKEAAAAASAAAP